MQFTEGSFYHIYNRGNDKRTLFFEDRNYDFFLQKVKKYIAPHCNVLAWCLMPNHFHFLIQANASTAIIVKETPIKINAFTEGERMLLSPTQRPSKSRNLLWAIFFSKKQNPNV